MQVSRIFHKAPTLYCYLETIIDFKWLKQDSLNSSIGLSQDEACSDLFENLSVNTLKGLKHEIFVAEFFTQFKPEWEDDLGTRK
jgi:hypothetical protein